MTSGRAYYNDTNKAAVAVMRELIADGVIPPGDVDDRSIEDVQPDDLAGYAQVHLFAGGGLWPVAARIAGWPDARPIWTGSCPCQPFSVAGKGAGKDDPRHLWPHFLRLIRGARTAGFGPPVIMGEQVSGKAGYGWFDGVRADLEAEGFACRTRDIPALAVDAPHERNRLYWLAVGDADAAWELQRQGDVAGRGRRALHADARHMDDAEPAAGANALGVDLAHRDGVGRQVSSARPEPAVQVSRGHSHPHRNGSFWSDAEWIICHDGKARRAKSGLPLLVDGFPGRVDLWSLAGNAISPVLAAEVISAFLDAEQSNRPAA